MKPLRLALTAFAAAGIAQVAVADPIPYPTPGLINPITYTFTAASTGNITAYFVDGAGAGYTNEIGMYVNGVFTGIQGLNNHSSFIGQSLVLGSVNAGDVLTFVMFNLAPGLGSVFSDPTLNGAYDHGVGLNHIYSTAYTATSPLYPGVPVGTYVTFEDIPSYLHPDFNYKDEAFVFTNVATSVSGVPDGGATLALLGMAFSGMTLVRRKLG